jgi:hypothetical protein
MSVAEYEFFGAQVMPPDGQPVTLNGRKFLVNRDLRSSGRMLSFVYPVDDAPIPHAEGEELEPAAHLLPCEAVVFWDEVQALPGRQAKLLTT